MVCITNMTATMDVTLNVRSAADSEVDRYLIDGDTRDRGGTRFIAPSCLFECHQSFDSLLLPSARAPFSAGPVISVGPLSDDIDFSSCHPKSHGFQSEPPKSRQSIVTQDAMRRV